MRQGFFSEHWRSFNGDTITGGVATGRGFTISWQNGAMGRGNDRHEPNGAFVEDVIAAALDRLNAFQETIFFCDANDTAIRHLASALESLDSRTQDREHRSVEGTHQV